MMKMRSMHEYTTYQSSIQHLLLYIFFFLRHSGTIGLVVQGWEGELSFHESNNASSMHDANESKGN